jgi:hypothetical protein
LAQSARDKQLNQARWLLIVVGLLTMALNGYLAATARTQLEQEVRKQGIVIGRAEEFDHAVRLVTMIGIVAALLGALFVVFGLIIKLYPVPVTVLSLVLYVGATLVFAAINPQTLVAWLIFKIIIVVVLISAIKAAIAYEKERAAEQEPEPGYD